MFSDPSRRYLPSYTEVRCRGVGDIRTVAMMTMLGKNLYVLRTPDELEVCSYCVSVKREMPARILSSIMS